MIIICFKSIYLCYLKQADIKQVPIINMIDDCELPCTQKLIDSQSEVFEYDSVYKLQVVKTMKQNKIKMVLK